MVLAVLITSFIMSPSEAQAQIIRQGNVFVQDSVSHKREDRQGTKTPYTYQDKKGNTYPIYLSVGGKAYIIKVSKTTGKEYKQYLPEVTKQLHSIQPKKS